MPRLGRSLPRYRQHRASRQAVVTLNGRDHYLGAYGTKASKVEYDRLIGEWPRLRSQSAVRHSRRLEDRGAMRSLLEICCRVLPQQSQGNARHQADNSISQYLREQYGRTAAMEFGPLALKAIRQRMVEEDLSRVYINDHAKRIKRMFKWAVGEQLLPIEAFPITGDRPWPP
jgi:hypothetical protein